MSDVFVTLAQFITILWPLLLLITFVYSFTGAGIFKRLTSFNTIRIRLVRLVKNVRRNLLIVWGLLLITWVISLFAPDPTPGLVLPEPWNTGVLLGGFALLLFSELSELGVFRQRLGARIDLHRAQAISDLKAMDPYAFEGLITETYRSLGFHVQHVGHSGDHGVDVDVYTPQGKHWVVQCKRYRDSVGESTIRELYGTMISEKADQAVLVTTAEITEPARSWARGKPIGLIDGEALLDLIKEARLRTEGKPFDRFAHWVYHLFNPADPRPNGLRIVEPVNGAAKVYPNEATQPVRVQPIQYLPNGVPICPRCRLPMQVYPGSSRLYRCRNYPTCRVVLEKEAG